MGIPTSEDSTGGGSAISRVPELEGIRGIAISLVLLFHLRTPLLSIGWCGVDLFFVLSGFLITSILLATKESRAYFRSFYGRRVLRIFPLYFVALFVVFYLGLPIAQRFGWAHAVAFRDQIWFWLYVSNWRNAFGHNLYYLSHFWSLAVEEQYYLFWPLAVFLLSRRSLASLCFATVIGCLLLRIVFGLSGANPELLQRATIFRIDTLAMGGLVALLVTGSKPTDRMQRYFRNAALLSAAVVVGVIVVSGTSQLQLPMVTLGYTALGIASAWVVWYSTANCGSPDFVCRVFRARPLRELGKYSYGMYVLHYPLIILVLEAAKRFVARHSGQWSGTAHLVAILIGFGGSYLAALVSWKLIESHFLRLKDKFRYESKPAVPESIQEERPIAYARVCE
jgi:peptidoglycan/LPS O-acetylase OafA/YrhL